MTGGDLEWSERAAALRREFDRSFAEAPPPGAEPAEDLLAIRVGTEPYVVRLAQVSGLYVDRRITPVPGPAPELLGIAGFRGAIVPVYDLGALLGSRSTSGSRWLVVAAKAPIALAFDGFEGHLRLPRAAFAPEQRMERNGLHVHEVVRAAGVVRPIVHLTSILDAIKRRAQQLAPRKE